MTEIDSVVAVFDDHPSVAAAVRALGGAGIDMTHLSVVGQGYHKNEKVVVSSCAGERIKLQGKRSAFWGEQVALLYGGVFVTIPFVGDLVVLGHLAGMLICKIEGAEDLGGMSVLGAAVHSVGIPKGSAIEYEAVIKANGFLVMVHGSREERLRAKFVLDNRKPVRVDVHASSSLRFPLKRAVGGL